MALRTGFASCPPGGRLHLAEGSEQHVGERAVHRLGHDDGEDQARGTVERAGNDQQLAVEHESHGRGGQAGIGIEQRDHRRHVRAADGNDHQNAEEERDHDHHGKKLARSGMQDQIGSDH